MKILNNLYFQVLIAIIIAIIFATASPEAAQNMKFLGDAFIKLIKMCIAPIIFCTIVLGITSSANIGTVGKIGIISLIYFEILTTIALIVGLVVAYFIQPGSGMNIDPTTIDINAIASYNKTPTSFIDFLLNIIPNNIFKAFSEDNILAILFIAIIFGYALVHNKESSRLIIEIIEKISEIFFRIIGYVMRLAPFGAFGSMSYTIGKYGIVSLIPLAKLMICFYITCAIFVLFILGIIMKMCQSSIFKLLTHIKEEIFLTFGTSSSESALPSLMKKMEKFGCKKSTIGIVIPSGYSFNLDGTSIYFTMAILFIAQAFNINLSLWEIIKILFILLITSKGAAGVTGSGFVTLAATLAIMPNLPIAGLALILGIDRFMSEARAITNLIGNAVASVAVSSIENKINKFKKTSCI